MTRKDWTGEGGTNGSALTTSDTGSGDAVNAVDASEPTYSTAAAFHGSLGLAASASAQSRFQWTGFAATSMAVRHYYKVAVPTASTQIGQLRTGAGGACGWTANSSGVINIVNSAGTGIGTTASVSSRAGTVIRIEVQATSNATTGTIAYQLFDGDSGTAFDSNTFTNVNTRGGNLTSFFLGNISGTNYGTSILFDDPAAADGTTTPLGPAATSYTGTPADPVGVTDAVAVVQATVLTFDDPVGITDTGAPQALDRALSVTDPVGATDSAADVEDNVRTTADPVGVTDAAVDVIDGQRVAADPVGITDSAVASLSVVYTASPADPVGVTDSASDVITGQRTPADPVGISDTASGGIDAQRAAADPVGVTDSATGALTQNTNVTPADPVGITDTAATVITVASSPADPVGATDSASATVAAFQVIGDPIAVTDTVTATVSRTSTPADPIGGTDTVTTAVTIDRVTGEQIGVTDAVVTSLALSAAIADSLGIADATVSAGTAGTRDLTLTVTVGTDRWTVTTSTDRWTLTTGPDRWSVTSQEAP